MSSTGDVVLKSHSRGCKEVVGVGGTVAGLGRRRRSSGFDGIRRHTEKEGHGRSAGYHMGVLDARVGSWRRAR